MEFINDAIEALRDQLALGRGATESVDWVGLEYGVDPAALRRCFELRFHMTPEDVISAKLRPSALNSNPRAEMWRLAQDRARRRVGDAVNSLPAWQQAAIGKPVSYQGKIYVFAGYYETAQWPLSLINVGTGRMVDGRGDMAEIIKNKLQRQYGPNR